MPYDMLMNDKIDDWIWYDKKNKNRLNTSGV